MSLLSCAKGIPHSISVLISICVCVCDGHLFRLCVILEQTETAFSYKQPKQ